MIEEDKEFVRDMRKWFPAWCNVCICVRNAGMKPFMLTGYCIEGKCDSCGRKADLAIVKLGPHVGKEG